MTMDPVIATVIGDPHFKVSNVRETDAMSEAIISRLQAHPPHVIVVLGDILDRHEVIHVSPLTRAVKFLARLMEIAPTYVLIGNHDLKNNRQFLSDEHPFSALKYWGPRMTVVDTTTMVTIRGQTFVFVPYVPPGRFEEALNKCPGWMTATCVFGHQEMKGAHMGAIISTEGDPWPLTHPFTVLGHIHDFHELQPNIIYTGTPIQHAFGDRHDKTISQFTFRSPNDRDHERIDLGLPRKHIVRLNCAEVSTYVPQANCELKIIISGTSGEIKAIMKHPNIDIWKRAGYKIVYKDLPLAQPELQHEPVTHPMISKAPLRFSAVLYHTISARPRLGQLFNRIFGGIRMNPGEGLTLRIQPLKKPAAPMLMVPVPSAINQPTNPIKELIALRVQPVILQHKVPIPSVVNDEVTPMKRSCYAESPPVAPSSKVPILTVVNESIDGIQRSCYAQSPPTAPSPKQLIIAKVPI